MKKEIILLIGPAGVGKSIVGSQLAKYLGYKWLDSDIYLHDILKFPRKQNYSREEFEKKKELETEILKFGLGNTKVVYSAGAGFVSEEKIYLYLIQKNFLFVNVILLLISEKNNETRKILNERIKKREIKFRENENFDNEIEKFRRIATNVIYTKKKSVDDIVQEITQL